jgi:hypothetical protein
LSYLFVSYSSEFWCSFEQGIAASNYIHYSKIGGFVQILRREIMKDKLEKTLFTEQEAATYFGWSVFTMREIRKRGEIECLVFNDKTIRYTLEQLENYKNQHLAVRNSETDNKREQRQR